MQSRNENTSLEGQILKFKTEQFVSSLENKNFKVANGWLNYIKNCFDIEFRKESERSASISDQAIKFCFDWKALLPSLMTEYTSHNIFNADDTGLFLRYTPDREMSFKHEN